MPVAYPSRSPLPAPEATVVVVVLPLLLAGAAGLLPALTTVAVAVGVGSTVATVRLVRLARAGRPAVARPGRVDRPTVLLDGAVPVAGSAVAGLPLLDPDCRSAVVTVGLLAVAVLHTLGLFLLPGRAPVTLGARLREATDGVSLGLSLVFAGWQLLPAGGVPVPVRAALLVAAGGVAAVLVTASTGGPRRPGVTTWRVGAAATQLGLAGLVTVLAYRAPEPATLLVAPPLVAGALLTVLAARRLVRPGQPHRAGPPPVWPRITAPAAIAMLAAGYHLVRVGEFERTAVALGLVVIPLLVLRELLTAADNRRYADRLVAQEARFRALVSGGHDLIVLLDDDLRVRWQSPAATRLFGLADADVLGRPFGALLHPDDAPRVEALLSSVRAGQPAGLLAARMRDGRGVWRETESTVSDQRRVPEVGAVVLHVRDVGERCRLERRVRQLAVTDQLTGLANRAELRRALAARGAGEPATLLLLDLHGLSEVNDGRGQTVGDHVLTEVARRLRAATGPDDLAARLAGNEFAVIVGGGTVPAYGLATRLLAVLTEPYRLPGWQVRLEVSIGLADTGAGSADEVLSQADLARRRAGQLGRNRIESYDVLLEEQVVRRLDLERELPGAVARGELDLVYQPVLRLADRLPVGTEALLCWRNPLLGTVPGAELLPVAADLGLLPEVGRWVLDRACRQLAGWSVTHPDLWMAVNVTPAELTAPDFVVQVTGVLARYGLSADRLVVEVAEAGVAVDPPTVAARLGALRSLGVRTALADLHAGRVALSRLRELPLDLVKIGPRAVGGDPDRPLAEVVVHLGRRLGLEVVADGLDSPGQVERAQRSGCPLGQGVALSRAATAERVEAFLAEYPSPGAFA